MFVNKMINKTDERDGVDHLQKTSLHPNVLSPFVTKMSRLEDCDPIEIEQLNQRFTYESFIDRPAFWFHVGSELPEGATNRSQGFTTMTSFVRLTQ